jgi:hypothetical protein
LEAIAVNSSNPQAHFYLGLVKQLQGEKDYRKDYDTAIRLYLKPDRQAQAEDYFILLRDVRLSFHEESPTGQY